MRCCVPFCKNTPDNVSPSARKGISFHSFPHDVRLRAAWLRALGKQDRHLPDSAVVCSQHFLDDDIYETEDGLRQICTDAIPSTVQVCMICLDTDSKLFLMSKYKLEETYEKLIGHPVCDQGNLKQTLCVQCAQKLINFSRFRDKSLRGRALMMDLVEKHELITRKHIKMINRTKHQLKSNFEVKMLGPNHCDLYILEDKQTESFSSLFNTTLCTEITVQRVVVKDEEVDSRADKDVEMANVDDNNANSSSNEFVESNEETRLTLCSEEFVSEHAYMQHMPMHGQIGDRDADCGTSQVCKPHTAVSSSHSLRLTENKQDIQQLKDDSRPCADSAQTSVAPLSARLATNAENNVQEADTIQKSIQAFQINNEGLNSQLTNCVNFESNCSNDGNSKDSCSRVKKNSFTCHICNNTFKQKTLIVEHMKIHTDTKSLTCNFCQFKCKYEGSLKRHMHTHISGKYACQLCDYECARNSGMVVHMRTHTGEKPYSCELCEHKCAEKSSLAKHMRTHTSEKPYSCTLCEYKFSHKQSLVIHMRNHTGEKPYSCRLCEYKCKRNGSLVEHMRTHTGEKPYYCTLCKYKCSRKHSLVIHMRNHTGEKPYSCELCEYKCTINWNLVLHIMRKHTGEKPYYCTLCKYKCSQKNGLVKHMKTHTGEQPYSCTLCKYKFSQKCYLVKHMRTHTGEKPYSCELCEYKCTLNGNLVTHMRTHTGEKPYSCTLCKYKSTQQGHLRRHMKSHTGE